MSAAEVEKAALRLRPGRQAQFVADWESAGSIDDQNRLASGEAENGRIFEVGNFGLAGETILAEAAHHTASLASLDQMGSLEVQIVGWGVEVHRGCSRGERASVEGISGAVAGAADSERMVGFVPSAAERMTAVGLVVSASAQGLLDAEHSENADALAISHV